MGTYCVPGTVMLEIKRGITQVLCSQRSMMGETEKASSSYKTVLLKHYTRGDGGGVKPGSLPGRGTIWAGSLRIGRSGPYCKGAEGCSIPKWHQGQRQRSKFSCCNSLWLRNTISGWLKHICSFSRAQLWPQTNTTPQILPALPQIKPTGFRDPILRLSLV